jgi:hypothetical protein
MNFIGGKFMPLSTMKGILIPARKKGYAADAFEFWSLLNLFAVR